MYWYSYLRAIVEQLSGGITGGIEYNCLEANAAQLTGGWYSYLEAIVGQLPGCITIIPRQLHGAIVN